MSRSWRTTRRIAAADLFGGLLEKHGVREKVLEASQVWESLRKMSPTMTQEPSAKFLEVFGTNNRTRYLTDGTNQVEVSITERGTMLDITHYGDNDPNDILRAIDEEFDAGLIDEDDPDHWQGFEWRDR